MYFGEKFNGLMNGFGIHYSEKGEKFKGFFKNGKRIKKV